MSKKKPIKKIFENAPIEPADGNDKLAESVRAHASSEETASETNPQEEDMDLSIQNEASSGENSLLSDEANMEIAESLPADERNEEIRSDSIHLEDAAEETSTDDLLEDVRRSLIEAESDKDQKESKWWRRIGRKAKRVEPQESPFLEEIDLPSLPTSAGPRMS